MGASPPAQGAGGQTAKDPRNPEGTAGPPSAKIPLGASPPARRRGGSNGRGPSVPAEQPGPPLIRQVPQRARSHPSRWVALPSPRAKGGNTQSEGLAPCAAALLGRPIDVAPCGTEKCQGGHSHSKVLVGEIVATVGNRSTGSTLSQSRVILRKHSRLSLSLSRSLSLSPSLSLPNSNALMFSHLLYIFHNTRSH